MNEIVISPEWIEFIRESNKIEKIFREPTHQEMREFIRFMALNKVTIEDLNVFVSVYEPKAKLRDQYNMNIRVGRYYPPFGGPDISIKLQEILDNTQLTSYQRHVEYEKLHPYTDGNGRSGRMLWAWQQRDLSLGFLHMFYYQVLQYM
jgi:hypothetical protein